MRPRRKNVVNSQSSSKLRLPYEYPIRSIAVYGGKDLASRVQRFRLLPQMLKAAGWEENKGLGVKEQVWGGTSIPRYGSCLMLSLDLIHDQILTVYKERLSHTSHPKSYFFQHVVLDLYKQLSRLRHPPRYMSLRTCICMLIGSHIFTHAYIYTINYNWSRCPHHMSPHLIS